MFKKNLYVKNNLSPFKISRTKIDLFFDCKRCFYLDQRLGIKRPHGTPLVINNLIVKKFKTNIQKLREIKSVVPSSENLLLNGFIPYLNENLSKWTDPFKGISTHDKKSNLKVFASIDDIWINNNKCFPVIIKSIARNEEEIEENIWHGYTRQLSLLSFLLEKNKLEIGKFGIIVMINASDDVQCNDSLSLNFFLFKREIDISWVSQTFMDIKNLLDSDKLPQISSRCKFCNYSSNVGKFNE